MKKFRYIKVTYSAKTNPEVMAFQLLVRNYSLQLKKYDIKVKYIKNIRMPFDVNLYDKTGKLQYNTNDYRRLKFMIKKVGFFNDEPKLKSKKTSKTKINKKTKIKKLKEKTNKYKTKKTNLHNK